MRTADDRPSGSWAALPTGAKAFRLAHVGWGIVNLASLGTSGQARSDDAAAGLSRPVSPS